MGAHKDFINQWEWIVDKLEKDRDSRQAIININYPGDKLKETKDFPCTVSLQVFIRENKLYWITHMRSQDIFYGTRNDIYCFTEMMQILAKRLNVELGTYYHVCNSLHIYENQFDKLKKFVETIKNDRQI